MAKLVTPEDILGFTEYPNSFLRQNPWPLEKYELFNSLETASEYAAFNTLAYVGQRLVVLEGEIVKLYYIAKEDGTLVELASQDKLTWTDYL